MSALKAAGASRPVDPRVQLALSLLQHRCFCPSCALVVDQVVLALQGATVDELRRGVAQ